MFSKRCPPSFVFRISIWACVGTLSARLTAATGWPPLTRSPTRTLGTTCLKIQT